MRPPSDVQVAYPGIEENDPADILPAEGADGAKIDIIYTVSIIKYI